MISETHNVDCMKFMAGLPDGFFDLVIADPPYGIGEDGGKRRQKKNRPNSYLKPLKHKKKAWDASVLGHEYFAEIFRVSKNQILWGANHYTSKILKDSSCWIVWDKNIGGDQADCELAWTGFETAIRKFYGHPFIGTNGGKDRIHPTQKPVALYKWLLTNYAKPGHKIFDPMMGSQSSRIAAHDMGFDYWGCELDADYFRDGEARYKAHIAKPVLFPPEQMYFPEQVKLFQ